LYSGEGIIGEAFTGMSAARAVTLTQIANSVMLLRSESFMPPLTG